MVSSSNFKKTYSDCLDPGWYETVLTTRQFDDKDLRKEFLCSNIMCLLNSVDSKIQISDYSRAWKYTLLKLWFYVFLL